MKVKILGCSGGIGSSELQTTSILVGNDTVIDAGTGLVSLTLEQLATVNNLFLTHSHMDHIAACPLLIDSTSDSRTKPLTIYALQETINALRAHIFNWLIWPDFSELTINNVKSLEFKTIKVGEVIDLAEGGKITVGPADHQVPACSYLLEGKRDKLFFSGDTCYDENMINFIHQNSPQHLIIECAFSKNEAQVAKLSKHMDTGEVSRFIKAVGNKCRFYITHLKPSQRDLIMDEIFANEYISDKDLITRLFSFQIFTL